MRDKMEISADILERVEKNPFLTPKAMDFLVPIKHWEGGCFPPPSVKLDSDILES